MDVPAWIWLATVGGLFVLITFDLFMGRKPHVISVREASGWVACYVTLALLFGVAVTLAWGGQRGTEFFAGYLMEYSLSVDNLFVFMIILARFKVPVAFQHRVLLIGIMLALGMRGIFIAIGAAAVSRFSWTFYVFGAVLLYGAWKLFREGTESPNDFRENALLRGMRRILPTTERYHGAKLVASSGGRRFVTPMLVVMMAIGTTDLLFALDSIPAIFGLTKEPYLVFTANVFALLGLRQLYFLIGGLLNRLVYLSTGLSVLLAFIGVKLILEALHGSGIDRVGHYHLPEIGIVASLVFIVTTLGVTTAASLLRARHDPGTRRSSTTGGQPGGDQSEPADREGDPFDGARA